MTVSPQSNGRRSVHDRVEDMSQYQRYHYYRGVSLKPRHLVAPTSRDPTHWAQKMPRQIGKVPSKGVHDRRHPAQVIPDAARFISRPKQRSLCMCGAPGWRRWLRSPRHHLRTTQQPVGSAASWWQRRESLNPIVIEMGRDAVACRAAVVLAVHPGLPSVAASAPESLVSILASSHLILTPHT